MYGAHTVIKWLKKLPKFALLYMPGQSHCVLYYIMLCHFIHLVIFSLKQNNLNATIFIHQCT
uniref:Uncharacterized protein n=1 Tax=Anguilla anguilla TaxID=7936 RepID=A0A0E9X1U0_ANGAN